MNEIEMNLLEHYVKHSYKKSAIMTATSEEDKHIHFPQSCLNGDILHIKNEVKYRGHIITDDLSLVKLNAIYAE